MDNQAKLQNLKDDCDWYTENNEHYSHIMFLNAKHYMNSDDFTVTIFNGLTDIEKLYCFEFMTNSEKFIEFAFKTQESFNILPKIILNFISKINKTLVRQYVNSIEFTIDIFKVLDSNVKIYIILLFNSTRATEYLFEKTDNISNFAQLYTEYTLSNEEYKTCPLDKIYVYYPFLIVRALKADKRFFNSIKKSRSDTRQMSFLQTITRIFYIKNIIKTMINIHKKHIKYVPGLNPYLSLITQFKKKGKKNGFNLSVLTEDNFNNIGESLYKEYNSLLLKTPALFDKLKKLIEFIDDYQKRNKVDLESIEQKIMNAYKLRNLHNIPEEPRAHGNLLGDTMDYNSYNEFFVARTIEEYRIINEVYINNAAVIISRNSKSSKSNSHYEKLLLSAKLDKPNLDPRHLINVGRR
jgi:hypothetical protein